MTSQVSGVRLADRLEKQIQELVDTGFYLSSSEFIREAVRDKLQSMNKKAIPDEIAEKEIKWFIKKKRESGQNVINIIEFSQELMLPCEQIDRIMSKIKGAVEV